MNIKQGAKKAKDGVIRMKNSVVDALEKGMDTVTGKAVIEKVDKFALAYDAVNTAIVTRIYEILDRQTKSEARHERTRSLLILSLVLNAFSIFAIVYIFARGK
jgi:hypothetical protein